MFVKKSMMLSIFLVGCERTDIVKPEPLEEVEMANFNSFVEGPSDEKFAADIEGNEYETQCLQILPSFGPIFATLDYSTSDVHVIRGIKTRFAFTANKYVETTFYYANESCESLLFQMSEKGSYRISLPQMDQNSRPYYIVEHLIASKDMTIQSEGYKTTINALNVCGGNWSAGITQDLGVQACSPIWQEIFQAATNPNETQMKRYEVICKFSGETNYRFSRDNQLNESETEFTPSCEDTYTGIKL